MVRDARLSAVTRRVASLRFVVAVFVWVGWALPALAADWPDPPVMDMQECVQVQRFMGPNPYSSVPNDFSLVTAYQENGPGSAQAPEKAFYLLNSVLVDQQHETGVVYFSSLIVNIARTDHDTRRVSFWMLADTDGDGKLDKAVYRETETAGPGEEKTVSEAQATDDQLAVLQRYYDQASSKLNAKAEDREEPETCDRQMQAESI